MNEIECDYFPKKMLNPVNVHLTKNVYLTIPKGKHPLVIGYYYNVYSL